LEEAEKLVGLGKYATFAYYILIF